MTKRKQVAPTGRAGGVPTHHVIADASGNSTAPTVQHSPPAVAATTSCPKVPGRPSSSTASSGPLPIADIARRRKGRGHRRDAVWSAGCRSAPASAGLDEAKGLVTYALIVALIAIVAILALILLGTPAPSWR
jgi:hypothetical protein